jgi:hypothetical protein
MYALAFVETDFRGERSVVPWRRGGARRPVAWPGSLQALSGKVLAVGERYSAAKVALGLTVVLAVALVAMAVLDAAWLGFVVIALFFGVLIAREVTVFGVRGFLLITGGVLAVIAVAFVVSRLA